ncbi:hypothetical protein TNCV_3176151 [Trichonephila clavipes]|nr:hypothetical protein TNCV_3176151 [Trichonephila clavipes]
MRDHRGVAPGQEVGNDEGCVVGGIAMLKLDRDIKVSPHARDPAFQSPEHLQVTCSFALSWSVGMILCATHSSAFSILGRTQTSRIRLRFPTEFRKFG